MDSKCGGGEIQIAITGVVMILMENANEGVANFLRLQLPSWS